MSTENKQTFIPITPDLLDGTKNARGKEVVLSTGQVLQRIQFADFVKELGLEENSFEFKAITPASPAPTKTGIYFPMSAGKYQNFGNFEITEEQFDSSFIFIVFDGYGFQILIKPIDFIPTGKIEDGETNAVSGGVVFNELNPIKNTMLCFNNIITNGDFKNSTTGWTIRKNITEYSVVENGLKFKGAGDLNSSDNWIMRSFVAPYIDNHVMYITATVSSEIDSTVYVGIGFSRSAYSTTKTIKRFSHLAKNSTLNYPTLGAKLNDTVTLHNVMCFDLTAIFGEGNEPDKSFMDDLFNIIYKNNYKDGKYCTTLKNILDYSNEYFLKKSELNDFNIKLNNIEKYFDLTFKNLILNGGFENNKTNWISAGSPGSGGGSSIDDLIRFRGGKSLKIINNNGARREEQKIQVKKGSKYFISARARIESYESGVIECANVSLDVNLIGEWQFVSYYLTPNADAEYNIRNGSYTELSTYTANFDEISVFDLTEIFGEGNEPSDLEIIKLYNVIYSDKTVTIDQTISQLETFNYFRSISKPLNNILDGVTPIVTLASDDGFATDYDLYKMLQKHGMRGTTFAVSTYFGKNRYLTEDQVKEMADAGWEFGCHTYQHLNLATLEFPDGVISQVLQNKKYLENLTGKKVTTFAHPFGGSSPEIRNLLNSFYDGARVSPTGYNQFGDIPNIFNMRTYWDHHTTTTIQRVKNLIDDLINKPARHLMISMHQLASEQGGDTFTLEDWEEVAIYLKEYQMQGKLQVVTFAEAIDRIKNSPFYNEL